jgi:hypothetical protein
MNRIPSSNNNNQVVLNRHCYFHLTSWIFYSLKSPQMGSNLLEKSSWLERSRSDVNQYTKFLKLDPPPAPSQIISPSQVARRYRSQTYNIEYRAELWAKTDSVSHARTFLAGDETLAPNVAFLNEDFWKRFSELPGEGKMSSSLDVLIL